MRIHIILLSCVCSSLAITVHYETTGSSDKNVKQYKTELKDIRLVPVNPRLTSEFKPLQRSGEDAKLRRQNPQTKSRGDKKKYASSLGRIGSTPKVQNDQNQQNSLQKMANQLYVAQKHASLLSDYQKFIVSQDQDVKTFVLGQSAQERTPKPFSRQTQRHGGRSLSTGARVKNAAQDPVTEAYADSKKIVVVTPKVQIAAPVISKPQNDHLAQATHIKYVTVAPQSLTHFVESHEPSPKVTLVPYHSPQQYAYYDLGSTIKPHIETVQIPSTASHGLGSYESPKYYTSEGGHAEDNGHQTDANYEFMYNVKDHEKRNHFGHKESRTDKTTYGYYFVHLPDGRLETVKYWADKTGYHAKVDYQGEAKHPPHTEHKFLVHNVVQN